MPTMKLTKPIMAHGEQVTELTFKEPNGHHVAECGYPFRVASDGAGDVQRITDAKSINSYISKLAEIPLSSVGLLSLTDWQSAMVIVINFFADAPTETTNS